MPTIGHRIWIDVEDLFDYAAKNARPSGIQRLAYEICRALATADGEYGAVGFVRHATAQRSFRVVAWRDVEALYSGMTRRAWRPPRSSTRRPLGPGNLRRRLRLFALRLPRDVREPLFVFLMHQRRALSSLRAAGAAASRPRAAGDASRIATDAPTEDFTSQVRPGDTVVMLGAFWFHPNYAALIEKARAEYGIRFGLLVYDLIPLIRPEWCEPDLIRIFRACIDTALPVADILLTISHASAADIRRYAREAGIAIRHDPVPIPLGTGFHNPQPQLLSAATHAPTETRTLPPPGSFALIVSTIEVRKNHILIFNVWRRLLDDLARETVPTLVFAGRLGWLVADLIEQLENCGYLGGKIVIIQEVSDSELEQLYAGCQFTLFPSFYEGWGLPVSESLAFGRPCIASSATSIPEAGGTLARYFDPSNEEDAYAAIRRVIERPQELSAWREQVAREFRPVSWNEAAAALVAAVQPTVASSTETAATEATEGSLAERG